MAKRKKEIFITTIIVIAAGVVAYLIKPEKYKAEILFILKNPLYADRNYLYNNETKFIDYFANDDDIDRLITMSRSDSVQDKIIKATNLAAVYHYSPQNAKEYLRLRKKFNKNLQVTVQAIKI